MKTVRLITIVLTALALLVGLSVMTAAADTVPGSPVNVDPGHATVVDGKLDTFPANNSLWFRFDYAGDKSQIVATLVNGGANGLQFNVFTPSQIADWWDETPIGRGNTSGGNTNDLVWTGNSPIGGTYYIQVVNPGTSAATGQLMVQGDGVTLVPATLAQPSNVGGAGAPAPKAPSASAAPVVGPATDPAHAALIDNQPHIIPAGTSVWYSFNYVGDKSQILLSLVNGAASGLQFNVWTPARIGDWWNETPIGRGAAQNINCDTGVVEEKGACKSNDLIWTGNFDIPGTYYIQVTNPAANAMSGQLMIQGTGVMLAPAAPQAPSQSAAPAAVAVGPATDPNHAALIDNQSHTIPAGTSLWYSFNYVGDKSQILLTLVNGGSGGLKFNLFTPAQIGDWWNETPIGRGTVQSINCTTGEIEAKGTCQASDLTWNGNFDLSGMYFVQVVNPTASAVPGQLTIQGTGVTLK